MKLTAAMFISLSAMMAAFGAAREFVPPTEEAMDLCQGLKENIQSCQEYSDACSGSKINLPKKAAVTVAFSQCRESNGIVLGTRCVVVPSGKNTTDVVNGCFEDANITAEEIGEGGICCSGSYFVVGSGGSSSSADDNNTPIPSGATSDDESPSTSSPGSDPTSGASGTSITTPATTSTAPREKQSGAMTSAGASIMALSGLMATVVYALA